MLKKLWSEGHDRFIFCLYFLLKFPFKRVKIFTLSLINVPTIKSQYHNLTGKNR